MGFEWIWLDSIFHHWGFLKSWGNLQVSISLNAKSNSHPCLEAAALPEKLFCKTRWLMTVVEDNYIICRWCLQIWYVQVNQICKCFQTVGNRVYKSSRKRHTDQKMLTYWNPNCACDCYCLGMVPRQTIQPHIWSLFTPYEAIRCYIRRASRLSLGSRTVEPNSKNWPFIKWLLMWQIIWSLGHLTRHGNIRIIQNVSFYTSLYRWIFQS